MGLSGQDALWLEEASRQAGRWLKLYNVRDYGAVGNDTADDTTKIQAALTAARTAGGGKVYVPAGTYKIAGTLLIGSGTWLELDPAATIHSTTAVRLLRNYNYSGSTRDSNITVTGGTWARGTGLSGATVPDTLNLAFYGVDGIYVRDLRVTSDAGKFGVTLCDCTKFACERLDFATNSDGVHLEGPCSNGVIRRITGTTVDDTVSLTGNDYTGYNAAGGGAINDVLIEDIDAASSKALVKVLPGATLTMTGITVRCVRGTAGGYGVLVVEDTGAAGTTGGTVYDVRISDVCCSPASGLAAVTLGVPTIDRAIIENIQVKGTIADGITVQSGTITRLIVGGLLHREAAGKKMVSVASGATVTRLSLVDADATLGSGGSLVNNSGTVNHCFLVNCATKNGTALYTTNSTTAHDLHMTNPYVEGTSQGINLAGTGAVTLHLTGGSSNAGFITVANGSAAVTVRAQGFTQTSGNFVFRTGSQSIRMISNDVAMSASIVSPQANDVMLNNNGSHGAGAGLLLRDSANTLWKNLYTGTTSA